MAAPSDDLDARDPKVGDLLYFEDVDWSVTGRSIDHNEDGDNVVEWCCEKDDTEAYLLKEPGGGGESKWFFTRWIDPDRVSVAGGGLISSLLGTDASLDQDPPKSLAFESSVYSYKEKSRARCEDDDGENEDKVTWEFWDPGQKNNLAVEIWQNGQFDCYFGRYVQPSEVILRKQAGFTGGNFSLGNLSGAAGPFYGTVWIIGVAACGLAVITEFDLPFDVVLAFSIVAGTLFVAFNTAQKYARVGALAALFAAGLLFLFWKFPPFSSALGFAGLFISPFAFLQFYRSQGSGADAAEQAAVSYFSAVMLALPLAIVGLAHYFLHAPSPHSLGQYCLALAPSLIGGIVGFVYSLFISAERQYEAS